MAMENTGAQAFYVLMKYRCFDYINFYSLLLMVTSISLKLLCLPLQTVDVFAVVALSGILSRLLSTGTILVATSNRAPEDLNQVL